MSGLNRPRFELALRMVKRTTTWFVALASLPRPSATKVGLIYGILTQRLLECQAPRSISFPRGWFRRLRRFHAVYFSGRHTAQGR